MVPEPETSYLIAGPYSNKMRLVRLLGETGSDGWPIQQEVAQVKNPEKDTKDLWPRFANICSSPKGDILVTMSVWSKYVVIWSIYREEIKAVHKLKLCDEDDEGVFVTRVRVMDIYCSTKSDIFAFVRSDGSVGIANFRTREIVTVGGNHHMAYDYIPKVRLNSDDTRLAVALSNELLVY